MAAAVWSMVMIADVPEPMATHFNGSGQANGFSSPWLNILLLTGMAVATLALLTVLGRAGLSSGPAARFNAAAMGFTVVLLCGMQIRIFEVQRGLEDAATAELSLSSEIWVFVVAAAVATLLALITRPVPDAIAPMTGTVPPLDVPDGVRVAWFRTETLNPWIQIGTYGLVVGLIIFGLVQGDSTMSSLGSIAFVVLVVVSCSTWRLRVDADGFSYRSVLGLPRSSVPYDEISFAQLIDIHAGEWGGWGWRFNGMGTGLITRSGPGFRITRTNRKVIEVPCEDAERCLATLRHHGVHVLAS
ncbi:MAG: DUF1648 domain-containing protein [Mycobacteriaceae bacterium]